MMPLPGGGEREGKKGEEGRGKRGEKRRGMEGLGVDRYGGGRVRGGL